MMITSELIDNTIEQRRQRREKEAAKLLQKAMDDIVSGNCSEQTRSNLLTVHKHYRNTPSVGQAIYTLGFIYETGMCGEQNTPMAYAYYSLAKRKNYRDATTALNQMTLSEPEREEGVKLYNTMRHRFFMGYSGSIYSPIGITLGGVKYHGVNVYASASLGMSLFTEYRTDFYGFQEEYRIGDNGYRRFINGHTNFNSPNSKSQKIAKLETAFGLTYGVSRSVAIYAGIGYTRKYELYEVVQNVQDVIYTNYGVTPAGEPFTDRFYVLDELEKKNYFLIDAGAMYYLKKFYLSTGLRYYSQSSLEQYYGDMGETKFYWSFGAGFIF